MTLKQVTTPTLPIDPNEAKTFFRVIGDEEDVVIASLLQMATARCEEITNRAFAQRKYELYLDNWQKALIPRPPLVDVEKVEYLTKQGAWVEYADVYKTTLGEPSCIIFSTTPNDWSGESESIKITYTAGYTEIPPQAKQWILNYALTNYENRENVVVNGSVDTKLSRYYDHLLDSLRIIPV